jgi:polysaccharide export outer membrane protein
MWRSVVTASLGLVLAGALGPAWAQTPPADPAAPVAGQVQEPSPGGKPQPAKDKAPKPPVPPPVIDGAITPPADYVIGPDDVIAILFWREKDLSADPVVVRPDGKITLPLINDVVAAGLTPDELRQRVEEAAGRYVEDATATVVVKAINSRKFYVTGSVSRPGPFMLSSPTTVLQALALAGGLNEFAKSDRIVIMRQEGTQTKTFKFNYKDVVRGRNLSQNIAVRPGDTIVVP